MPSDRLTPQQIIERATSFETAVERIKDAYLIDLRRDFKVYRSDQLARKEAALGFLGGVLFCGFIWTLLYWFGR